MPKPKRILRVENVYIRPVDRDISCYMYKARSLIMRCASCMMTLAKCEMTMVKERVEEGNDAKALGRMQKSGGRQASSDLCCNHPTLNASSYTVEKKSHSLPTSCEIWQGSHVSAVAAMLCKSSHSCIAKTSRTTRELQLQEKQSVSDAEKQVHLLAAMLKDLR
jgi:hypothetical protein